ncbi:MAG: adenylate/guanylate cyclase domain-containing protein [Actinomycetota bacterium]|nr:adenylate/guanylate cyclase domain-containing protein [Actinomycetota bacterium]
MADPIDFEAEGLLEGLEGDEREGRRALLERLADEGTPLEDLRSAVEEGRLAVLPVEHLLAGEPRYSIDEVAERSGVPKDVLIRQRRALGVATPEEEGRDMSADDLDQAHRARALLDAGLEPDEIAELGRTIAVAMSQFAAASRQVMTTAFATPADTEGDISDRIYDQSQALIPLVGPTLEYVYRLHLREQLRHAAFGADELRGRSRPAAETVAIAFADLVGYTELGEAMAPEELGRVTGRLDELAREVAGGPVRLVKLIGDAAMLASSDTDALVCSTFDLIDGMAAEGKEFPLLRAGIARGSVLSRGGDYYGAPVNLASRITGAARANSVLVTGEVKAELDEGGYRFSDAGHKQLKGIRGAVHLYRCRELDDDAEEDGDEREGAGAGGSRGRRRRRARRSSRHSR